MIVKTILVTGGAGFIGSHVVRHFVNTYPSYHIVNLDVLTYAGNLENLSDVEAALNYTFVHGDISDQQFIDALFDKYRFDGVIHLAAESHVDRSISEPLLFAKTNIMGTLNLLNAFKGLWQSNWEGKRFYHISTDEVYGSLGEIGLFTESTAYDPNSPYSASKASSDHFVRAYGETYKLPYVISNCSNNYGAFQFPEKLIPLCINNIVNNKALPIYGNGLYTRDWLFVNDHVKAIDKIFHEGETKSTYNVGGNNEWTNIDLVKLLCDIMDEKLNRPKKTSQSLIQFVKDRPGHDLRYAIDASKLMTDLHWQPTVTFKEGLTKTVEWYLSNAKWLDNITSGVYQNYYKTQYQD